jgi:Family of unknown function (DUF6350)
MGRVPEIEGGAGTPGQTEADRTGPWPGRAALRGLLARLSGPVPEAGPADLPALDRLLLALAPVRRRLAEHAPDLALGAAVAGLIAVAGWLLAVLITFGVWGVSAPGAASPAAAFHVAGQLWLSAHHVLLDAPDGPFGLTPLGFTLLPLAAFCLAGRLCARRFWPRFGDELDEAVQRHPASRTEAHGDFADAASDSGDPADARGYPWSLVGWPDRFRSSHRRRHCEFWALGALAFCYPIAALLIAWTAAAGTLHAAVGAAAGYPCLLAVTAFGVGVASVRRPLADRRFTAALPALAMAAAVLVAAASLAVAVLMVLHERRMGAVGAAVGGGAGGEAGLFLIDLALAPNLLVWAVSVLLGPGFALGVGSSISVLGVRHGALPGLPVLQAIPAAGPTSRWALLLFAVPLAAALGALTQVVRRLSAPRDQAAAFGGAAVAAAFLAAVAAALSGGPVALGPMALVGPGPGALALSVLAEFLVVGLLGLAARALVTAFGTLVWRRGRLPRVVRMPAVAAGSDAQGSAAATVSPDSTADQVPHVTVSPFTEVGFTESGFTDPQVSPGPALPGLGACDVVAGRDTVFVDDDLPEHLVRPGLPLGIPERPQVVEDRGQEADRTDDEVHEVAHDGHPEADEPAVGLADEPDAHGALADGPAVPPLQVPLEDGQTDQQNTADDGPGH